MSFAHGKTPTLNNVNLAIETGSITVLEGQSGAGKTTLIDLLLGLHNPDQGRITLDGIPLSEIDMKQWR